MKGIIFSIFTWQYFWTPAQYDVTGMTKLLGGKEQFTAQLDRFFTIQSPNSNRHLGQEALIGQYAHGNEPSHHVAYLYSYSSKPETGKQLITKICNQFYNNTPGGIIGNDDCGQMSAWYIFSTLGFYPVNPASGAYVLGQPQVQDAMVKLQGGKKLVIKNERRNMVLLNGRQVRGCTITHQKIAQGAVLNFWNEHSIENESIMWKHMGINKIKKVNLKRLTLILLVVPEGLVSNKVVDFFERIWLIMNG